MWILAPIIICVVGLAVAAFPPAYPEARPRERVPLWLGASVPVAIALGLVALVAFAIS